MIHELMMTGATEVAGSGDTITVAGLSLLLAALALFVGRIVGIQKGRKDAQDVNLTNVPLRVELEKEFVRRDEWQQWRGEVRADSAKMEGLMQRLFDRVDVKHNELLATIERAAKTGVDGRVALWNDLRDQIQRLSKVETNVDVSAGLKALAAEMKEARTNPKK